MDIKSSKAFVEEFTVKPYRSGCFDGLSYAVKDNINLKAHRTSYGSKPWRDLQEESLYNALCVDQLLAEGASCLGKTIADEYTYSLSGEGSFWETALNGNAPDRIPGGSSSKRKALRILQTTEFGNTVGEWVEQKNPELGRIFGLSYRFIRNFDRTDLNKALVLSAKLRQRISSFPGRNDLFLYPTTPTVAPLKDSLDDPDTIADFYNRTMAVTSFAGVSRIPELSLPITRIDDVPIWISLAGGVNRDEFVL